MSKTCCGKEWTCRFCGDCARPLDKEPIHELLSHCQKTVANQHSHLECAQAEFDNLSGEGVCNTYVYTKRLEGAKRAAVKWERWTDALAELIAKSEGVE